jgi:Zn-dependent M32 family carboxypeptidase
LYDAPNLIERITGTELNVKPYLSYLNEKYSNLYCF